MRPERFELPVRIVLEDPIPGLAVALQKGQAAKATLVPAAGQSANAKVFDLSTAVEGALPDGRPRLLGPFVQGPPGARFVYLCVGQYAGQTGAAWAGRIKVPLGDIGWEAIEALSPDECLCARIAARSPKGGSVLASVKLLPPGWVRQA